VPENDSKMTVRVCMHDKHKIIIIMYVVFSVHACVCGQWILPNFSVDAFNSFLGQIKALAAQ